MTKWRKRKFPCLRVSKLWKYVKHKLRCFKYVPMQIKVLVCIKNEEKNEHFKHDWQQEKVLKMTSLFPCLSLMKIIADVCRLFWIFLLILFVVILFLLCSIICYRLLLIKKYLFIQFYFQLYIAINFRDMKSQHPK